jgi:PHD/YefM family antitoxin component YafN of YafNO toxin-antitoxin module
MKTMTAVEAKNSFGQLLEAALREPVAVTKNRREVAAMFSMEDVRALADTFLAAPLKADVADGKIGLLDALMAQVDLNRRLEAGRKAIAAGDGIVADATYFGSLRDRALRRVS